MTDTGLCLACRHPLAWHDEAGCGAGSCRCFPADLAAGPVEEPGADADAGGITDERPALDVAGFAAGAGRTEFEVLRAALRWTTDHGAWPLSADELSRALRELDENLEPVDGDGWR